MTIYQPWSPYTGSGALLLAAGLLIAAAVVVYLGARLPRPLAAARPGWFVAVCLIVAWLLAVSAFLVSLALYVYALLAQLGRFTGPGNPITPITAITGMVAFAVILYLTVPSATSPISQRQFWAGVASGVLGAIAGVMIFELPYDLIVLWRTHPPAPHALFTLVFFLPLLLSEILSFALLTLSPFVRLSRASLFLFAALLLIFAVWALAGFAYPSKPVPFALNVAGKIVAFATAVSLFLPHKPAANA